MDNSYFEGTLVLEKLAENGLLDDFFSAIDSDDFSKAKSLMEEAGIDAKCISTVLEKMADADPQSH